MVDAGCFKWFNPNGKFHEQTKDRKMTRGLFVSAATSTLEINGGRANNFRTKLFDLNHAGCAKPLEVHGFTVVSRWHMIVQIQMDHCDLTEENSEWGVAGIVQHMALAIAIVIKQMDDKRYQLVSETAVPTNDSAVSRLIFRKLG